MRVGAYKDGSNNWQTYYGFERFRIDSLIGKDVLAATLTVHQYYSDSCTSRSTEVYPTAVPSVYSGWTWNNKPAKFPGNMWNNDVSGAHGGGTSCPEADVPIDVTRQVNGYTTGEIDSNWAGDTPDNKPYAATLGFKPDNQTAANELRFCSANTQASGNCSDPNDKPVLSVTYRPLLGMDTATSTFDHRLNDAASLHVNTDTGNAMVKSQDLNIAGIGQDLSLNRWYNSAANDSGGPGTTSLGTAGWSLNVGPDVYMERVPGYTLRYDFHAPGGAVYGHYVRKDTQPPGSGGSSDYYNFFEPSYGGVDATLKDDNPSSGPDTFTLTKHASQLKYHFTQVDSTSNNLYLTSTEDRSGNTITYTYVSGSHKLQSIVDTDGRSLSVAYNTAGYIHTITDSFGPVTRVWTYDYDTSGHGTLVDYIDPTGAETDYSYTLISGKYFLTTITDPEQTDHERPATVLTYPTSGTTGQLVELQYQTGTSGGSPVYATFTLNYASTKDAACNKGTRSTVLTDLSDTPSGATTYCFQDVADGTSGGQPSTEIIDGIGNRRSSQYSPDRKPASFTSPEDDGVSNGSTVATYGDGTTNPTDQLQSVTQPHDPGNTSTPDRYYYTASSSIPGYKYLPSARWDSNGHCTRYFYNSNGLVNQTVTGVDIGGTTGFPCPSVFFTGGHSWHATYNTQGQTTAIWDENGNSSSTADQTTYTYNSDGELATMTRPGGSCTTPRTLCTSYTYDGDGRMATMTDGRGKTTTFSYDKADRVTQVRFNGASSCSIPSGDCLQYTYDKEGNLATRTDIQGTTTFGYDMLNQQSSQDLPDGSSVDTVSDAAGNLLEYDQTVNKGIGTVTDSEIYTHNAANQTVSAKNNNTGGATDVVTLQPNKDGKINKVTYPTTAGIGSVTTLYTTSGHVKSVTPNGTALPTYAYSWAQSGQETNELQSVTTTNGQSSQDGTINYTYNRDGQLTAANDTSSQPDYSFSYDGAGNLQSKTIGPSTTYYGYTEAGVLCWKGSTNGTQVGQSCPSTPSGDTTVNHDANGNNTGTAGTVNAYDGANRASSLAGVAQSYLDQGNNLRSGDGSSSSAMTFVNGPLGVTARVANGNVTFYIRNTDGSLLEERGASGTRYYILGNHQSVTGLIDANGSAYASYLYGPYGDSSVNNENGGGTAADNPWRWNGGYQDAVEGDNLYHFGARYFDPANARWTQPDPKTGSINSPASLETFSFGGDDPMSNTDMSGTSLLGDVLVAGAGILSAGITGTIAVAGYLEAAEATALVPYLLGVFGLVSGLALLGLAVVAVSYYYEYEGF